MTRDGLMICDVCGSVVANDDLLSLEGLGVCASCKPEAVARLREQGGVSVHPLDRYDFAAFNELRRASDAIGHLLIFWWVVGIGLAVMGYYILSSGNSLGVAVLITALPVFVAAAPREFPEERM